MIIKKTFQGAVPDSKIFNTNSNSQVDTYSCDKINRLIRTSGSGSGTTYSTEEQIAGTWVDGRPVYVKTVVLNIDTTAQTINAQHGIDEMDELIDVRGSIFSYDAWKPFTNIYLPQLYDYSVAIYAINAKGFTINVGKLLAQEKGLHKIHATFYYTKTTD